MDNIPDVSDNAKFRVFPLFLLAAVWLGAMWFPAYPVRTPPIPGGFSRGIALADTEQREVPCLLPDEGGTLLVWSEGSGGAIHLRATRVLPDGEVASPWEVSVPGTVYLGRPHLCRVEEGVWLIFLGRGDDSERSVFMAPLASEGELGTPLVLTGDVDVRSFAVAADHGTVWLGVEDWHGEEHLFRVMFPGPLVDTWDLGPGTGPPALAVSEQGVHITWPREDPAYTLMYSVWAGDGPRPPVELFRFPLPTGAIPSPPAIGLQPGWVYVAVGFEFRGGEVAGSAEVRVVSFPAGSPHEVEQLSLRLPGGFPEEHSVEVDGLDLAPLPPQLAIRPTDLYMPRGVGGAGNLALFVMGARLYRRTSGQVQPVVVALDAGNPVAWTPIAASSDFTYFTELRRSQRGWHAAFLDMLGYGEYRLYYASTAPGERERLDRVGWDDWVHFLGTTASGMVGGLALIPLFIMASVPGLVLIFLHYLVGGEESLRFRWPKVLLVLGLLPYVILKIVLASTFGGVPFSDWLARPTAHLVGLILPFVPSFLAVGALLVYVRRAVEPSLFPAWAVFVATDMAFTVLILGPAFAGG